jgi:tRNA pseudouridine32 synthase/23S rRNA pseudouridine746 synthase
MGKDITIPIIWQDDDLLVINKPAGLLSIPDGYDPALPHVKGVLSPEYGPLWIVHRLDRQTSGVLLLARSVDAHRWLNTQFQERRVEKVYRALVQGVPAWEQKNVNLPLLPGGDRRHRTVVDENRGLEAFTQLRVIERYENCSLVEASPGTGRRHQIRAHLSALGVPIVGDELYGSSKKDRKFQINMSIDDYSMSIQLENQHIALHASSIRINHPRSHQRQSFQALYPPDFADLLAQLRASQQ